MAELREAADKSESLKNTLLLKCKSWGGPLASVEELHKLTQSTDDQKKLKSILRTEMNYKRKTSSVVEISGRSELYRINKVTLADLKTNLLLLLTITSNEIAESAETVMLAQDEMFALLSKERREEVVPEPNNVPPVNEPCVAILETPYTRGWYVGFRGEAKGDENYMFEKLEPCSSYSGDLYWRYPRETDLQIVSVKKYRRAMSSVTGTVRAWFLLLKMAQ